jgi:shikimate dehydrogenase
MPKPEIYAVTGKPVVHSLSPELFGLLFRTFSRNAVYTRLAADSALEALATARAIGLRGLNVTAPFKEDIVSCLDGLAEDAMRIGAVNCLTLHGAGPSVGYNTDHIGLIGTLRSSGVSPRGRAVLVLGTGGAGRAAAYGLLQAGAARVVLAGRTLDRAQAAARALGCQGARLEDVGKILGTVDIVVSSFPFSASRVLPVPVPNRTLLVDAHYASSAGSPKEGNRGPSTALRWLFHQAIPSFEIFTGLKVPKAVAQNIWDVFEGLERRPRPHIALVGFMGAGKTTTGRQLARLMGRGFTDTDDLVEATTGMTVPAIFKRWGEGGFRSREKSVIKNIAPAGGTPMVISVGGGAVLDKDNRARLAKTCRIVWLWTAARTALSRIDIAMRPVLDPDRPLESASRTLASRVPLYASVADLIVNSESGSPPEVARRIKDEMDQTI